MIFLDETRFIIDLFVRIIGIYLGLFLMFFSAITIFLGILIWRFNLLDNVKTIKINYEIEKLDKWMGSRIFFMGVFLQVIACSVMFLGRFLLFGLISYVLFVTVFSIIIALGIKNFKKR